jgi:hypothetical protein
MARALAAAITAVLAACLVGCGDGGDESRPTPTPTSASPMGAVYAFMLPGAYDVALSGDLGNRDDLVGFVFESDGEVVILDVRLSSQTNLALYGWLASDGSMRITGFAETPRRSIAVEGRGVATRDGTGQRIVGTVRAANSFLDFELGFTADRSSGTSVLDFNGTHRFAFGPSPSGCGCDSTATFDIAARPDGWAEVRLAVPELDARGAQVGGMQPIDCFVTQRGRLICYMFYGPPGFGPPYAEAYLFGQLAPANSAVIGVGRFEALVSGDDEPTHATWTATHVDAVPQPSPTTSP